MQTITIHTEPLFQSFFLGGFECSTHRSKHGRRLDLIAATQHDTFARQDYGRLRSQGIAAARDGIRWHLIEASPHRYDFSSVLPMLRAARDTGIQIIWDLCHYGWPDDLDIFSPAFVERYASLAGAFARLLLDEGVEVPFYTPLNEISFFAWAGGTVGYFNPYCESRGDELKEQLVRATIAGIEAVWAVNPSARIVHPDPVINVACHPDRLHEQRNADDYTQSQFEAWDMIAGLACPHLGGKPAYLDIVGVNYYPHNQWIWSHLPFNPAHAIPMDSPLYKPFRRIVADVWARYGRPIIVAETGADNERRPAWLAYVCEEVRGALEEGVHMEGLCLYPILNFPWWDDGVELQNGLWGPAGEDGNRLIYEPLAMELARQRLLFDDCFLSRSDVAITLHRQAV